MRNVNTARPIIMHIDLNSCFATVEQQAHVTLRGRPVGILNRRTENTMLVTASYEAKATGVGLGMSARQAKRLCPEIVFLESDPFKYRYVYHKLMDIMNNYSAHVRMKSIDEGVIDFSDAPAAIRNRPMTEIGHEIKQRLRDEIGKAMRCNIGLGTNRFLAKTAASLHKPDGLDEISYDNLRQTYNTLELKDLNGISDRFEARLNSVGIYTPLELLDTKREVLERMVFKSVVGGQWYQRLRGWEVDKIDHPLRSAGRQYVIDGYRLSRPEVLKRLHHLCEEVGAKVRSNGMVARGVYVFARDYDGYTWRARHHASLPFFSDQAIYSLASRMFEGFHGDLKLIGVTCYDLEPDSDTQVSLFGDESIRNYQLMGAVDEINNRYGRRTISSADSLSTNDIIRAKIPFGSVRYM